MAEEGKKSPNSLGLHAVKEKLSNIPHDEKSALVHVQRIHPELADDEHILQFLRVENFDVDLATKRLVRYWNARYKYFGPDRFALPMTLTGAMKDSMNAVKKGFPALLPQLDDGGRAIIYNDWSLIEVDNSGAPMKVEELTRAFWYSIHVAMENPIAAKNGFVTIANWKNYPVQSWNLKILVPTITTIYDALPIKWKQAHGCYKPSIGLNIMQQIITGMGGKEMIVLHSGSQEAVLESLSKHMVPLRCAPTSLGGVLEIDSSAFLKQRLAIEPHASVTYFPFIDQTCARNAQEQDEKHDMLDEYLSLSNKRKRSERNVNADNVSTAIHTVKIHLSNIPHDEKSAFVHVQRVRPELVNDKHILQFLRVENFDTNLATQRLVRYWEERYQYFGPDRFALPMTLEGAMKNSVNSIRSGHMGGFPVLLPYLDDDGRSILFNDWTNVTNIATGQPIDFEEWGRVWWYLIHVMLENPVTAEKGYIILEDAEHARLSSFDTKWLLKLARLADRAFPLQWSLYHFCHGNTIWPMIAKVSKAILSLQQRETFLLHNGSKVGVLESLSKHKMPKHCVPTSLGGTLTIDTNAFVEQRLVIEKDSSTNISISLSLHSLDSLDHIDLWPAVPEKGTAPIPTDEQEDVKMPALQTGGINSSNVTCIDQPPESVLERASLSSYASKPRAAVDSTQKKPGRAGDPRMRKAVEAKLINPELPLISALIVGGFVFPDLAKVEQAKLKSTVLDVEGISLYQRRNQLLRRLRLAKEGPKKTKKIKKKK